uniref:Uncharacterized protein n=1 Tax=viral metagenome TaxID=1070528 RepID=A0A6H1ZUY3_9ZZZZ
MIPIFRGQVLKGVLQVDTRFYSWLSTLEGQEVDVIVRKKRKQRSLQQNRYYHGVIIKILADHCGYSPEEMHEALKEKFLGTQERDKHGLIKMKSTAVLSKDEFIQYTNEVIRWAAENLTVYIPDPHLVDF